MMWAGSVMAVTKGRGEGTRRHGCYIGEGRKAWLLQRGGEGGMAVT